MSQSALITSIGEELSQSPIAVPAGSDLFALYKRGVQRKMTLAQLTAYLLPLIESGWDDIQGPVSQASGLAALTQEAWGDTTFPGVFFRHDQDDIIYWSLQLPHRWNRGEVRFHLHFTPMGDPAVVENIRFDGSFAWAKIGSAVPLAAGWTAITPVTVPVNPGDLRKHRIAAIFSTTPTTPLESDILLIKLRRPGAADALDTYTTAKATAGTPQANVGILMGDAHFQINKAGTVSEIPSP